MMPPRLRHFFLPLLPRASLATRLIPRQTGWLDSLALQVVRSMKQSTLV